MAHADAVLQQMHGAGVTQHTNNKSSAVQYDSRSQR
jgi:hypothetical protein